jgi:hypothetical protein
MVADICVHAYFCDSSWCNMNLFCHAEWKQMWVKYSESSWSPHPIAGALQTTVDVSPSKGVFGFTCFFNTYHIECLDTCMKC